MNTERDVAVQRFANSTSENWQLVGTVTWGVGIALIFFVTNIITTLIIALRGQGDLSEEKISVLLASASGDGVVLSVATFVTTLVCVPVVVGVAKLKKHSNIKDYFALKAVPIRSLMVWLGILIIFNALSDGLTVLLGKPIVPEFMGVAYASARPAWMLWLAFVVAAPLFEETFFRGFLFTGFASSVVGPLGAVAITSVLWAAIHMQYDLYGIGTLFLLGILLGLARMLTGSLIVPLALHSISNIIAVAETALLG